jgi:hypothetical protein
MPEKRLRSFKQFWPFYLGQHSNPATRALHIAGTSVAIAAALAAAWTGRTWLVAAGLVAAYGAAWVGHFFIEHNRPATFTYPWWSFRADLRMCALWWRGRLDAELRRHGV